MANKGGVTGHAPRQIQQHQWIGGHAGGLEGGVTTDQALGFPSSSLQTPGFELLLDPGGLTQGVQQQQMPMPQMPMPFVPPTPMPFMQQQQRTMLAPNFSVMNGQIAPPDPTTMMPSMKGLFGI